MNKKIDFARNKSSISFYFQKKYGKLCCHMKTQLRNLEPKNNTKSALRKYNYSRPTTDNFYFDKLKVKSKYVKRIRDLFTCANPLILVTRCSSITGLTPTLPQTLPKLKRQIMPCMNTRGHLGHHITILIPQLMSFL